MTGSRLQHHVDLPGSVVALFGMVPCGRVLATRSVREGVSLLDNVTELHELAIQARNGASRRLHSIIIVACSGDDFSDVPAIYNLAVEIHILVTIIIITGTVQGNKQNTGSSGILQRSSDIIVVSSDDTCLQHMLDLVVG